MEGVVRELGGASEVTRMTSTPEPEPVEVDEPIIEEESEEEEEEVRELQPSEGLSVSVGMAWV